MGFSKYLLFADDSRFHLGFINGPYAEVSYHQCHIKSGSFLLVHFPPANLLFANLSFTRFIISRNPAWDMFHQGSSGNLNSYSLLHFLTQSVPGFPQVLMIICPPTASLNLPAPTWRDFAYKFSLCVTLYLSPSYLDCHTRNYWKYKFSFTEDQYLHLGQGKLEAAIKNSRKIPIQHKVKSSRSQLPIFNDSPMISTQNLATISNQVILQI